MNAGDRVIVYRPGSWFHEARGVLEYLPPVGEWPAVVAVPDSVRGRRLGVPGLVVAGVDELLPDREWAPEQPGTFVDAPDLPIPPGVIAAQHARWDEYVQTLPSEPEPMPEGVHEHAPDAEKAAAVEAVKAEKAEKVQADEAEVAILEGMQPTRGQGQMWPRGGE